jgi:hypothetical protein
MNLNITDRSNRMEPIFRAPAAFLRAAGIWIAMLILALAQAPAMAASTGAAVSGRASAESGTRAVELTFLKSAPGKLHDLRAFVRANWFAMDAKAVEQGLMLRYEWLDLGGEATDRDPWDAIVKVTYLDARGYDGIREGFERIRREHKTVLINGQGMRELGRVVETKRLFEDKSLK